MADPTYIFRDGNVYTLVDGKVVSSVKEADFSDHSGGHPIDGQVEMPAPPAGIAGELQGEAAACPSCGSSTSPGDVFCPQCGTPLGEGAGGIDQDDPYAGLGFTEQSPEPVHAQPIAKQTVTTPNGLKGRVLARVPSLWGEEVTVRFENGVIKKIPVDQRLTFASSEETEASDSPVKSLEERLGASTLSDKDSLIERAKELDSIKVEARKMVAEASDADAVTLDRISVQADYEAREVSEALAHYADLEGQGFEAPAPIENLPAVEQASLGGVEANWLDATVGEIVAEASSTDYTKLMDEGPEAFVAGLDDTQLADSGTVRVMASREIRSHTAGADEDMREKYERVWLARVEEQRRGRLASRKEEIRKEAASEDGPNAPDEALFL